jgi:lysophospholipase L1-like esterase
VPRVGREEFAANVVAMAQLARGRGARVLIIGTVYRDATTNPPHARRIAQWRGALARAAAIAGLPYLEIRELTERGAPHNGALFGEVIHPNAAGHRLLADRLYEQIRAAGLLPPP